MSLARKLDYGTAMRSTVKVSIVLSLIRKRGKTMNGLPRNSKVTIRRTPRGLLLELPQKKSTPLRYLIGIFLLCWLGGWFFGWIGAFGQIVGGHASGFIIFWLCGWTVGGIFAALYAFRIFQPAVPEQLLLGQNSVKYDTGRAPLPIDFTHRSQTDAYKLMFSRRKEFTFAVDELSTIKLRETESGNRLTIDHGATRIDIGIGISEVEREWLYNSLSDKYVA